jgi:DNA (cytosine-5)-methyltransferase 1
LAIDSNPAAIQTYRLNHPEVRPERIICGDLRQFRKAEFDLIREKLAGTDVDILVGGPPCQGFSRVGWRSRGAAKQEYRATTDSRNHLYRELVELLHVVRPRVVLMENVPGMGEVKFQDGTTFRELARAALEAAGYDTNIWMLNAAWYGVPQQRIRQMIVGSRVGKAPAMPPPEFRALTDPPDHPSSHPAMKLMEAIGDLPRLRVDDGQWIARREGVPTERSRYLERSGALDSNGFIYSHVSRFQNATDLERFRTMRPGETYMDLLSKRPDLENYRTDVFDDKYYRLRGDQPCRTIVAHLRKDGNSFIHPRQTRSLSVREAARVQSFPDSYIFTGSRGDQFEQIGNAVPPLLAEAMGRELLTHLFTCGVRKAARRRTSRG